MQKRKEAKTIRRKATRKMYRKIKRRTKKELRRMIVNIQKRKILYKR